MWRREAWHAIPDFEPHARYSQVRGRRLFFIICGRQNQFEMNETNFRQIYSPRDEFNAIGAYGAIFRARTKEWFRSISFFSLIQHLQ